MLGKALSGGVYPVSGLLADDGVSGLGLWSVVCYPHAVLTTGEMCKIFDECQSLLHGGLAVGVLVLDKALLGGVYPVSAVLADDEVCLQSLWD